MRKRSLTEQKADLLDRYISELAKLDMDQKLPRERTLIKDNMAIEEKHSYPFMEDVFTTRLYFGCLRAMMEIGPQVEFRKTTLIYAPHLSDLEKVRGIGKESLKEFKAVMEEYNLPEKFS